MPRFDPLGPSVVKKVYDDGEVHVIYTAFGAWPETYYAWYPDYPEIHARGSTLWSALTGVWLHKDMGQIVDRAPFKRRT